MNTETEDRCAAKPVAELRTCTAAEALRRGAEDVHVGDDEQVVLSTSDRAHQRYFARVKLGAFEDLQLLGLVPRGLRQDAIRSAIAEDDQEAVRLARERVPHAAVAPDCHCNGNGNGNGQRVASFSENLRATVRTIRRDYNPALARLLSNHIGTEFAWDSILAISVRSWASRFVKDSSVIAALMNDITIGRNSRLQVDPKSTSLLARHIRIHRTGTLAHNGGYLRIWANSIETFVFDSSDIAKALATDTTPTLWALNH